MPDEMTTIDSRLAAIEGRLNEIAQNAAVQTTLAQAAHQRANDLAETVWDKRNGLQVRMERVETSAKSKKEFWASLVAAVAAMASLIAVLSKVL